MAGALAFAGTLSAPVRLAAFDGRVYVAEGGQTLGPFDEAALRGRIRSQEEAARTMVWHQGLDGWRRATEVSLLAAFVRALPAETPVDLAAYIVGAWVSQDRPINVSNFTVIGIQTAIFDDRGAVSGTIQAEYLSLTWVPGGPIQTTPEGAVLRPPPVLVDRSIRYGASFEGTYTVATAENGAPALFLKGRETPDDGKGVHSLDEVWTPRIISPHRFGLEDGSTFRRR